MTGSSKPQQTGLGLLSEGFALGLMYAIGFVVVVVLRQVAIDSFALLVPAMTFAAIGGKVLEHSATRLLPAFSLLAVIAGASIARFG